MKYRTIKDLKKAVEGIMCDFPESRNNDTTLIIRLWERHFPEIIIQVAGSYGKYIQLDSLFNLPSESEISRIRRKIQETKYPPTDEKVARARRFNMDEWRVAMGYPTVATSGTPTPKWTPPSEQKII